MADHESDDSDHPASTGSPLRSTGFLAAAGFVVFVVIAAVAVVIYNDSGQGGEAASSTSPTLGSATASGGQCRPTDTDQRVPEAAPADVTWSLFHGVAVPSSQSAGPLITTPGGIARCYAHTPVGALIAVSQIPVRMVLADDWRSVLDTQVMPGPGRNNVASRRAKLTGPVRDQGYAQTVAFKFVTYNASTAVIQTVSRATDGSMGVYTNTIEWNGDWRLRLADDGNAGPPPQSVSSLEGYIPWGGL